MRGAYQLTVIKGVEIYIHWTFLILPVWIVMVYVSYGADLTELTWALTFTVTVFICILLHEAGHAAAAARYGIRSKNILLLPIGGIANLEKLPDNPRQELAVSFAGPMVNLLIAAILLPFINTSYRFWEPDYPLSIAEKGDFVYNIWLANIYLALFNLIPAFPLDGGRILRALLGFRMNYIHATHITAIISKIIGMLFIATGFVFISIVLPIAGIFIIYSSGLEERYFKLKALLQGIKLKEVLMFDYNTLQFTATVKDVAGLLMTNHSRYFIVMEGALPKGTINRMDIVKALAEKQYPATIGSLMKENLNYLDGEKEVDTVLEKLAGNGDRIYPVMENSHFAGVVNFRHLIEYLLINKASTTEYEKVKSLAGLT